MGGGTINGANSGRSSQLVRPAQAAAPVVDPGSPETPPRPVPESGGPNPRRRASSGGAADSPADRTANNALLAEQPWTLAEAEQTALSYHPGLSEFQARVDAARGKWLQAGLLPNPIAGYSGQQIGSRGLAEQDGVMVQQELIRGRKLRLGRSVAEQEIARAEQELYGQELRVLTGARQQFYEVAISQERLRLNEQLVQIGAQSMKSAEALMRAKEASRVDVLQARLELEQAKIVQENARNRYNAAWRSLAAAVGQPDLQPRTVSADVRTPRVDLEWDASLQRLLGNSPELSAAEAEIQRTRWAVDKARADGIPNVTVQGIVQRDASIRGTDGAIQVTMPIPVFNRNQGGVRQAEGDMIAAENAYRRLELELQNRLAPVYERYANARNQVAKYSDEILP
ncbi:MAG TPA: TolC family protein, partial [Pirellulaceae bacterium]|nr:TolC family protein [Pirellulaceae bacterium]